MRHALLIGTICAWASGCGVLPADKTAAVLPATGPRGAVEWTKVDGYDGLAVCADRQDRLVFRFGSQGGKTVGISHTDEASGPIQKAYRVSDDKVFVERHINPRVAGGVLCDLAKKTAVVFYGTLFAIDPRSFQVAYWREPHPGQEGAVGRLFVSGRLLLDLTTQDCESLEWNPSGGLVVTLSGGGELEIYPPGREAPADADE